MRDGVGTWERVEEKVSRERVPRRSRRRPGPNSVFRDEGWSDEAISIEEELQIRMLGESAPKERPHLPWFVHPSEFSHPSRASIFNRVRKAKPPDLSEVEPPNKLIWLPRKFLKELLKRTQQATFEQCWVSPDSPLSPQDAIPISSHSASLPCLSPLFSALQWSTSSRKAVDIRWISSLLLHWR